MRLAKEALDNDLKINIKHISELVNEPSDENGMCKKKHKEESQTVCRRPEKDIVAEMLVSYVKAGRIDLSHPIQVRRNFNFCCI